MLKVVVSKETPRPFQGAYNALGGLPLQLIITQSYPPPRHNEIDKVTKRASNTERMIRAKIV